MTISLVRCVPLLGASALCAGLMAAPAVAAPAVTSAPPPYSWDLVETGSVGSFRGLDAVDADTAWAASDSGEVLRTVDGGATFDDVAPPEGVTDELAFRDVEARDADTALVLSIGTGDASRVYRTSNGGESWRETFRGDDPLAFFDCMAMFDRRHGVILGDPVDGKFQILVTSDGGRSWALSPAPGMPDAVEGEFAFAASGTCANATQKTAWFATGGGAARVFRSDDYGMTWSVADTPIQNTPAGGIFSVDFRTDKLGIAIGGDFEFPDEATDALARSTDGGETWTLVDESVAPAGYRSGMAWWSDSHGDQRASALTPEQKTVFAVGPTGSDVSSDRGKTWQQFDDGAFHSVECVEGSAACWASGPEGRIATLAVG